MIYLYYYKVNVSDNSYLRNTFDMYRYRKFACPAYMIFLSRGPWDILLNIVLNFDTHLGAYTVFYAPWL